MAHYLLTGAGFSRNWGGWLANEAFEYLLGCAQIDDYLRQLLWTNKLQSGGFETALYIVQSTFANDPRPINKQRLDAITEAVLSMFAAMQTGFNGLDFRDHDLRFQRFLARFDAIFTLNQDTLLETHYAGPVRWSERWYGSYLPYMKLMEEPEHSYQFMLRAPMTPDSQFLSEENHQPIYKLHGSHNWFSEGQGDRLVVIGGNKTGSINGSAVLARYQSDFEVALSRPGTHLMVIGYSFGDPHINGVLQASSLKGMRMFIVDPNGVDVIDKRSAKAQIPEPTTDMMNALMPSIVGASRRSLDAIIYSDLVEQEKVERFFESQEQIIRIQR
jgi:hypothetical protein